MACYATRRWGYTGRVWVKPRDRVTVVCVEKPTATSVPSRLFDYSRAKKECVITKPAMWDTYNPSSPKASSKKAIQSSAKGKADLKRSDRRKVTPLYLTSPRVVGQCRIHGDAIVLDDHGISSNADHVVNLGNGASTSVGAHRAVKNGNSSALVAEQQRRQCGAIDTPAFPS